jgi:hypothetical protein
LNLFTLKFFLKMITQNNGATSNGVDTPEPVERRYVHLVGRATIESRRDDDQDILEVTFVDSEFKQLAGTVPLSINVGREGRRIKCMSLTFVAALSQEGYDSYKPTLKILDPFLDEWADLDVSKDTLDMTSTGPPKT